MKKQIFIFLLLIASIFFLTLTPSVYGQIVIPGADNIKSASINLESTNGEVTQDSARHIGFTLINFARIIVSGLALIYMVIIGIQFIIGSDSEDTIKKQKMQLLYTGIGFLFLNIPSLVYEVFVFNRGNGSLNNISWWSWNGGSSLWNNEILVSFIVSFLGFLKVFLFAAAIIMLSWAAIQLLASRGKDEKKELAVNKFVYGGAWLLFAGIIEAWTRTFAAGTDLQEWLVKLVGPMFGFLFFFTTPVAILFLIIGAYYYITSAGDEDRAKKGKNIVINTLIAYIILFISFSFLEEIFKLFTSK